MLVSGKEGSGGRRHSHPGTPRRRREWGWGRDQAPTPGRGDEGSMGAKESRIGFLSYEEALRRGEGGGVRTSCREGRRRAAQGVGDRARGGEAEGVGRGGGRVGRPAVGNVMGGAGLGDGDCVAGSEALPEGAVPGAGRAVPVLSGAVVTPDGSGEALLSPLAWVAPALSTTSSPTAIFSHPSSINISSSILTSHLAALTGGERGGGCAALFSLPAGAPSLCGVSAFSEGLGRSPGGCHHPHPHPLSG